MHSDVCNTQGCASGVGSAVPTLMSGTLMRKWSCRGQGALWGGGTVRKFSLTPLFQTHSENKDQGRRGRVTETEWGVLALQARPGCSPPPQLGPRLGPAESTRASVPS